MTISILQELSNEVWSSTSAQTIAVSGTVTAGSALLIFSTNDSAGGQTVNFVSDNINTGNYSVLGTINNSTDAQRLSCHYFEGSKGGAVTITTTYDVLNTGFRGIWLMEIGGGKLSGILDGNTGQFQTAPTTSANAVTSGNASNNNQPALIVGFSQCASNVAPTPTVGFTSTKTPAFGGTAVSEYKRIVSTGPQAATFTAATNVGHVTYIAIFDEIPGATATDNAILFGMNF